MAQYKLKPGKIGNKVIGAYQKTEQAFTERFLQEDPNNPSGYTLKTGKTAEAATGTYHKIEDAVVGSYFKIQDGVVGTYKKIENAFVDRFLEKVDDKQDETEAK